MSPPCSEHGTWQLYANYTDVLLADIYPVSNTELAATAAYGINITKSIGASIRGTVRQRAFWILGLRLGVYLVLGF